MSYLAVKLDDPNIVRGPGTVVAIFEGDDVVGAVLAAGCVWWFDDAVTKPEIGDRVIQRPCGVFNASREVIANLAKANDQHGYDARREILRRRIEAIGGQLAGQGGDEGVIDSAGNWHDLVIHSDTVDIDAELDAIEKIIVALERQAS